MKLYLSIAGSIIEIEVDIFEHLGPRAQRFSPFITQPADCALSLTLHMVDGDGRPPILGGELSLSWECKNGQLRFESPLEEAHVDLKARTGSIWVRPGGGVENFLRLFAAQDCLSSGGLLLHASGVIDHGKAYVMFGHSGSGKSTIAHLAARERVLGDDVVALRPDSDGLRAYAVPFGHLPGTANVNAPVAGLFRISHAPQHTLYDISRARGVAELLSCSPFVHDDPVMQQRALETAHTFAASVPIKALGFSPDPSVWTFVLGGSINQYSVNEADRAVGGPSPKPLEQKTAFLP